MSVFNHFKNTGLKKISKKPSSYKLYVSLNPITLGDWKVKASSIGDGILIVLFNPSTSQTIVKYFTNEIDAAEYMSSINSSVD